MNIIHYMMTYILWSGLEASGFLESLGRNGGAGVIGGPVNGGGGAGLYGANCYQDDNRLKPGGDYTPWRY